MEYIAELKYNGFLVGESVTNGTECCRKKAGVRKLAGVRIFLGNASCLRLEYPRVLHVGLIMLVLLYGIEQNGMDREGRLYVVCADR